MNSKSNILFRTNAELATKGVDVDAETWGGDGTVPLGFFLRDPDKNHLMMVQDYPQQ